MDCWRAPQETEVDQMILGPCERVARRHYCPIRIHRYNLRPCERAARRRYCPIRIRWYESHATADWWSIVDDRLHLFSLLSVDISFQTPDDQLCHAELTESLARVGERKHHFFLLPADLVEGDVFGIHTNQPVDHGLLPLRPAQQSPLQLVVLLCRPKSVLTSRR